MRTKLTVVTALAGTLLATCPCIGVGTGNLCAGPERRCHSRCRNACRYTADMVATAARWTAAATVATAVALLHAAVADTVAMVASCMAAVQPWRTWRTFCL